jgi:hypothetical protein
MNDFSVCCRGREMVSRRTAKPTKDTITVTSQTLGGFDLCASEAGVSSFKESQNVRFVHGLNGA